MPSGMPSATNSGGVRIFGTPVWPVYCTDRPTRPSPGAGLCLESALTNSVRAEIDGACWNRGDSAAERDAERPDLTGWRHWHELHKSSAAAPIPPTKTFERKPKHPEQQRARRAIQAGRRGRPIVLLRGRTCVGLSGPRSGRPSAVARIRTVKIRRRNPGHNAARARRTRRAQSRVSGPPERDIGAPGDRCRTVHGYPDRKDLGRE